MMMKIKVVLILLISSLWTVSSAQVTFKAKQNLSVKLLDEKPEQVVRTAFDLFKKDYRAVFSAGVSENNKAEMVVGTVGQMAAIDPAISAEWLEQLTGVHEGFLIQEKDRKIYILGSDKRGTAYGLLELSRLMGVSPWEWWADVTIESKQEQVFQKGYTLFQSPSVKHRGIFFNDEDWGLTPWSANNYEPDAQLISGIDPAKVGKMETVGPKTYAKVFELLLRLRANTIWPAMHEVTVPFYFVEGNREVAEKYGIYIGSAHCEPLARNSATEWDIVGSGNYNYLTNKANILSYWEDRLKELGNSDNIFTMGMRGKHDGRMEGVKTTEEYRDALNVVIKDQTELLKKYINPDPSQIPQVVIPYKEILDVYRAGLEVPDYMTLMWCDDNYGYVTHFPNEQERMRSGGNGVYYHISYWGRPHDYLWIATQHPALLYTQMKLSYDKGARDMWIVNVGDLKPGEYLTELFLDMAWDIDAISNDKAGLDQHLQQWLARSFGDRNAEELRSIMNEYYRLAYIRKPEFMGNTRAEERDPVYKVVKDLPWSEEKIRQRLAAYEELAGRVDKVAKQIPSHRKEAWFQLVEYPVQGAAEMNKKHLYATLARHGKGEWDRSDAAYETIVSLTDRYNNLADGKWQGIMDHRPRRLEVFDKVERTVAAEPLPVDIKPLYAYNGTDFNRVEGKQPLVHGLGYESKAISLPQGTVVGYEVPVGAVDSVRVQVALAPNHPVAGNTIRYAISINKGPEQVVDYRTQGRSEEWKENVLNNQAIRSTSFAVRQNGEKITVFIKALDEGVVIDQIKVFSAERIQQEFSFGKAYTDRSIVLQAAEPYGANGPYGFEYGSEKHVHIQKENQTLFGDQPFYFSLGVPEGNYKVTVGYQGLPDSTFKSTVRSESRRLHLEQVRIQPHAVVEHSFIVNRKDARIRKGEYVRLKKPRELEKLDWDDKLTLEFQHTNNIAYIRVEQVSDVPTIFLAGNSTVVNQEHEPWASWGQMIPRFFDDQVAVANHAESGLALSSFLSSKRLDKILTIAKPGDYLFIEFGHNDQKEKGDKAGAYTGYTERMRHFVEAFRAIGGTPLILTSTARRSFDSDGQLQYTLGDYPDAARKVAQELQVPLIDLNKRTRTFYESLGVEGSKQALVHYAANTFPGQPEPLQDNTHFNTYGAYQIAKMVLQGIRDSNLAIREYVIDFKGYNPKNPDAPSDWEWPLSIKNSDVKPEGN